MTMTTSDTKARNGVWTPWAQVLCVECEYAALKDSPRAQHYGKRLKAVAAMNRTEEVGHPEGHLIGSCDNCHCTCWVRDDVALLQQVGFKSSDLDWEGPFGWELQQTGGMCAALVFSTETHEIVVTAMDGEFFVGEYKQPVEEWNDPIRSWQSESLYRGDAMKPTGDLAALVDQCARKVIEFVHQPAPAKPVKREVAPAGTGQACGAANACHLYRGHEGQHEDWRGGKW